ncbi:hypothetical protein K7432_012237 [Basidiobolus ranarum]|uniref:CsbD family protein n=1 Tax=Basidiobolus ranarum TaxID=34480 RepID=A0ABR2VSL4_9FUNG
MSNQHAETQAGTGFLQEALGGILGNEAIQERGTTKREKAEAEAKHQCSAKDEETHNKTEVKSSSKNTQNL